MNPELGRRHDFDLNWRRKVAPFVSVYTDWDRGKAGGWLEARAGALAAGLSGFALTRWHGAGF